MTHCERIFSKPLNELTYSDIQEYFEGVRTETDFVEFKSYDPDRDISRNVTAIQEGVCAFLNSEGGLMVWGAPRGSTPSGQQEKIFTGDLFPLNLVPGKDRIVNMIGDKIIPLPNSFNLEVIQNGSNQESVIIIEIQKSEYSPHQTGNTYYMRMDGQTRIAPHHYVEALFKQIKYPEIKSYIKFTNTTIGTNSIILKIEIMIFNFSPLQNEYNVSYRLMCDRGKFATCIENPDSPDCRMDGNQIVHEFNSVLSFGFPFRTIQSVVLTTLSLSQSSGQVNLILQVVGKNSPGRMSKYKLDFNQPARYNTVELNRRLIEISENKLMIDLQEATGLTRLEQLRTVLERDPDGV